jgi:ribosome-associated protein
MADSTEENPGFEWRWGRVIPWRELGFRQDPAGGPGGQHANRSATRVTLTWNPLRSESLEEREKERIREAWDSRLTRDGALRIRSGEERSARRNRERCLETLRSMLREALAPRRSRKKTRVTAAAREKRLREKRQHAERKARRQPPRDTD